MTWEGRLRFIRRRSSLMWLMYAINAQSTAVLLTTAVSYVIQDEPILVIIFVFLGLAGVYTCAVLWKAYQGAKHEQER